MAHIQVPHTIKRAGFYYLNIRIQDSIFRCSLQTKSSNTALSIISSIMERIILKNGTQNMELHELKEIVKSVKKKIIYHATALLYPDSEDANSVNEKYSNYHSALYSHHDGYSQLGLGDIQKWNVAEPEPIKTLFAYKLDLLFDLQESPTQQAESIVTTARFKLDSEGDPVPFYPDIAIDKIEEKITNALTEAKRLRELIEGGAKTEAIKIFEDFSGVQSSPKESVNQELKSTKTFAEYVEDFLIAGEGGQLQPLAHGSKSKRKAWTQSILDDHTRNFKVFNHILGSSNLHKVTDIELDDLFNDVIFNMPRGNIKPYRDMNIADRTISAQTGEVEEKDIITSKTAKGYLKSLQSFYSWLLFKRLIDESPVKKMLTRISDRGNIRGALSQAQVQALVAHCSKENDPNKKWPVIIMAFTGMRNSEVMQLRKQDIKKCKDTGVMYIHVTPDSGSLKTESSVRSVPMHSYLINNGFIDFVSKVSHGGLFQKDGKFLTRFYSNVLKIKCDIPDHNEFNECLNLYSLRHFIVTTLQSKNINQAITQQIVGHRKSSSITDKNYTHKFALVELKKAIETIND